MATSAFRLSNNRLAVGGIDTNSGSLGTAVTLVTSSNFSIIPTSSFSRYYHIYIVQTDADITITLPTTTNVVLNWRAKFVLVSAAATGILRFSDGTTVQGLISTANFGTIGCEVQLVTSPSTYVFNYYFSNLNTNTQLAYIYYSTAGITNLVPTLKPFSFGKFFSYSGLSGSPTINGNNTAVQIIPWLSGTPGRYVDDNVYDTTANTRVQFRFPGVINITAVIVVNSVGGASAINRVTSLVNGVAAAIAENEISTISLSGSQVIKTKATFSGALGTYYEIAISKTATSAGSNPVDRVNTYLFAEYVQS